MSEIAFSELTPEQVPELITRVGEIIAEGGSHNAGSFGEPWWRWQYERLPTGEAHTYVALYEGEVRAYYHVPVYRGRVGSAAKKFGVIQGVAVSAALRGRGVFRRLAEYAHQRLAEADVDLIYTFPNDKSIHTFVKYNAYTYVRTLDAYVLPVDAAEILQSKLSLFGLENALGALSDGVFNLFSKPLEPGASIARHEEVGETLAPLFEEHQRPFQTTLNRDAAYLRWRFAARPSSTHHVLSLSRRGQAEAAAVFKVDEMLGVPALLLMDFAHAKGAQESLLQLLSSVKADPGGHIPDSFALIFATGADPFLQRLPSLGFLPVPRFLNPRPINLLVKNLRVSDASPLFAPQGWRVTLSDWDVF